MAELKVVVDYTRPITFEPEFELEGEVAVHSAFRLTRSIGASKGNIEFTSTDYNACKLLPLYMLNRCCTILYHQINVLFIAYSNLGIICVGM